MPNAEAVRGVPVLGSVYSELIDGPFAAGLCRVPDGAIYLVGAVSHPLRPRASRGQRTSGRR